MDRSAISNYCERKFSTAYPRFYKPICFQIFSKEKSKNWEDWAVIMLKTDIVRAAQLLSVAIWQIYTLFFGNNKGFSKVISSEVDMSIFFF